jgi:hypothetical protein
MKILLAVLAVSLAAPAFAEHGEKHEGKKSGAWACDEDVKKFCEGVEPGDGRLVACVMEHEKELSEGCAAEVAKKKEHEAKMKAKGKNWKEKKGKGDWMKWKKEKKEWKEAEKQKGE